MSSKKTIGNRVDQVVDEVSENVDKAKSKIALAKKEVEDIAHNISKSAKKAVDDSGDAVSDLVFGREPATKKKAK
ncbi:MAG: hypothetical protein WCX65_05970 [bacterium]